MHVLEVVQPRAPLVASVGIPFPFGLRPMLLKERREPFDGARWLFEPKWDGWRCVAVVQDGRATLLSLNNRARDLTKGFPGVAEALCGLACGTAIDGSWSCWTGKAGRIFGALMRRQGAPCLLAFDLLRMHGRDLCAGPVDERKRRVADVVAGPREPTPAEHDGIVGEERALFEVVKARG